VTTPRFAPKVHPATREVEAEDPLELHATPMPGDPAVMLACLVQEYAWLGYGTEEIVALFHDPAYPALNALVDLYGKHGLGERVEALVGQTGVLHFSGRVIEEPDPEDADEPELIQLGVRHRPAQTTEGDSHAQGL
jgi:hypothetical protein